MKKSVKIKENIYSKSSSLTALQTPKMTLFSEPNYKLVDSPESSPKGKKIKGISFEMYSPRKLTYLHVDTQYKMKEKEKNDQSTKWPK